LLQAVTAFCDRQTVASIYLILIKIRILVGQPVALGFFERCASFLNARRFILVCLSGFAASYIGLVASLRIGLAHSACCASSSTSTECERAQKKSRE